MAKKKNRKKKHNAASAQPQAQAQRTAEAKHEGAAVLDEREEKHPRAAASQNQPEQEEAPSGVPFGPPGGPAIGESPILQEDINLHIKNWAIQRKKELEQRRAKALKQKLKASQRALRDVSVEQDEGVQVDVAERKIEVEERNAALLPEVVDASVAIDDAPAIAPEAMQQIEKEEQAVERFLKGDAQAIREVIFSDEEKHASPVTLYIRSALYLEGEKPGDENIAEGLRLLRLAAERGCAPAQSNLGAFHGKGIYVAQDDVEAARLFRLAAQSGLPIAQLNLGALYYMGRGVPQDTAQAFHWYQQAAQQGFADAQYNVSVFYRGGYGVPKNLAEEIRLLKLSAEQGFASAQYSLGRHYAIGNEVLPRNIKKAVRLHTLAAAQGNMYAQNELADRYIKGDGVPQDMNEAARLYELSAKQGYALALYSLGLCYDKGRGVAQNGPKAFRLYQQAADKKEAWGQFAVGHCYLQGRCGVKQNTKIAAYFFKLAADQGNMEGQFCLATLYATGDGVKLDQMEGLRLMRLAAAQGHKEARQILPMLEMQTMTGVPQGMAVRQALGFGNGGPRGVSPAAAAGARQLGLMAGPAPGSASPAAAARRSVIPDHLRGQRGEGALRQVANALPADLSQLRIPETPEEMRRQTEEMEELLRSGGVDPNQCPQM